MRLQCTGPMRLQCAGACDESLRGVFVAEMTRPINKWINFLKKTTSFNLKQPMESQKQRKGKKNLTLTLTAASQTSKPSVVVHSSIGSFSIFTLLLQDLHECSLVLLSSFSSPLFLLSSRTSNFFSLILYNLLIYLFFFIWHFPFFIY